MFPVTVKAAAAVVFSFFSTPILAEYTTTLHAPGFDPQTILASIITARPSSTTYLLSCPTDEPDDKCGLGTGITLVEGPSTMAWTYSGLELVHCNVDNSMRATCTESYVSSYSTDAGTFTTFDSSVLDWNDLAIPVTVTAGETYSGDGVAAQTTTPTEGGLGTTTDREPVGQEPTGVPKTKSSSGSNVGGTQTTAAASSAQASTAASTSLSTGAGPRVTGNAVVAGAAAVLGGVLMI